MDTVERYAGDVAWTEWFERCSVARCPDFLVPPLVDQIRSAMFAQLARAGFSADLVADDDPVTFFDSYFQSKGSRDRDKPLKSYFKHRLVNERLSLRAFICGTFFSAKFGRIHDIVRDWIASVKGWKPHSLVGEDGKRHVTWECAANGEDVREQVGGYLPNPGSRLDRPVMRAYVFQMLDAVSAKLRLEKRQVAFLLYATARGIPASSPGVLAMLGVRKSRAAKIKEDCLKTVETYFADKEVETTDLGFACVMLSVCAAEAGEEVANA